MHELVVALESALGTSLLLSTAICLAGGFLASLSPCVYPLIPIVATFVGSKTVGEQTKAKAFGLSLTYVLGLALVYSALGMIAALTGQLFGSISSNPWAQFIVANLMILFGLNIMEVLPLPLLSGQGPAGQGRKGVLGAFLIGAASGLVASPCTAPVLGIILTFVATTQNVLWGGLLLFAFSLGMGVLLIAVGTFSGVLAALPKPGNWMQVIRKVLGLAMIGLGEYFLIQAGQLMAY